MPSSVLSPGGHPWGVWGQLWADTCLSARFPASTAAWAGRAPERCWLGTESQPGWSPGRPGRRLYPQSQGPVLRSLAGPPTGLVACLCPYDRLGLPSTCHRAHLHISATHPTAPASPAWEKPVLLEEQISSQSGVILTKYSPR